MTLSAEIKYKSNSQQGGLKARRRNKWLCALKRSMAECEIYGPLGNPSGMPDPKRYTEVPWEVVKEQDEMREAEIQAEPLNSADFRLRDKNTAISVFFFFADNMESDLSRSWRCGRCVW